MHVVPALAEEASGPAYSVVRLCDSLRELGVSIELGALAWSSTDAQRPYLKRFPIGFGPRRLGRSAQMLAWLKDAAESRKAQVFHSHVLWQMNSCYPAWAARKTSVRLVVSPRGSLSVWALKHGSVLKRLFWPLLQAPALKAAACIHATAWNEYEDIRRAGLRQPVAIIPNGVDPPSGHEQPAQKRKEVLYLGRLHPKKGLANLLRAWARLEEAFPAWQLTIAGPSSTYGKSAAYARHLFDLAAKLGVRRVSFPGPMYGEQKFSALRNAALFVLPTYSENFGIAVAEALICGTPVIVTKGAPWEGVLAHGAGWWIEIGVEPLARCLREAMSLPLKQLVAMGEAGRQWMIKDYSWKDVAAKMVEVYEWLVYGGRPPDHVAMD